VHVEVHVEFTIASRVAALSKAGLELQADFLAPLAEVEECVSPVSAIVAHHLSEFLLSILEVVQDELLDQVGRVGRLDSLD
jgi:hypothetical protein